MSKPAPPEKLANGAVVAFDPLVRKYAILNGAGVEHGYRRSLEDARAFAATLPARHWEEPQPAPIHRSPRAYQPPAPSYLPPGPQPDECPPPPRAPEAVLAYARAKNMAGIRRTR